MAVDAIDIKVHFSLCLKARIGLCKRASKVFSKMR